MGHDGCCYVCGSPLEMPNNPRESELFTCGQCRTVNIATGYGKRVTTLARHDIYVKYDGIKSYGRRGLIGEAEHRHTLELRELLTRADGGELAQEEFQSQRTALLQKHDRELKALRNAKARALRPIKKRETELRIRLAGEGKMRLGPRYL